MEVKAGDVVKRLNDGAVQDLEGAINAIDEEKARLRF